MALCNFCNTFRHLLLVNSVFIVVGSDLVINKEISDLSSLGFLFEERSFRQHSIFLIWITALLFWEIICSPAKHFVGWETVFTVSSLQRYGDTSASAYKPFVKSLWRISSSLHCCVVCKLTAHHILQSNTYMYKTVLDFCQEYLWWQPKYVIRGSENNIKVDVTKVNWCGLAAQNWLGCRGFSWTILNFQVPVASIVCSVTHANVNFVRRWVLTNFVVE